MADPNNTAPGTPFRPPVTGIATEVNVGVADGLDVTRTLADGRPVLVLVVVLVLVDEAVDEGVLVKVGIP